MSPDTAKAKKKGLDSDSGDPKSVSSNPEADDHKQPYMKWIDTSSTTNEPSSASATATVVSTAVARQPTSQSAILPIFSASAAAASPTLALNEKKLKRAGFGEQFLHKLRVMLDRESQNQSSTVKWSTDGNSFIITDQIQFEKHIVPTYFDNRIVFASFLSKIYRWGFKLETSKRVGHYEFYSQSFRRHDAESVPAAAEEEGARMQVQHPCQTISPLNQQVMAQTNHQPAPNPLPNSQLVTNATVALLSTIQHLLSSQQLSISSQQPVPNHVMQQNNDANNYLQPAFQQSQHQKPKLNLLNTAISTLFEGQAPVSAQLMGHSFSSQNNVVHALVCRLYNMMLPQPSLPYTITSAGMSNLLVLVMRRIVEEEVHRRAQVDAINHAIITTIRDIVSRNKMFDEAESQRELRNPTGMTIYVPNRTARPQKLGAPPPPAGNLNVQEHSIDATRRGDAAWQIEGGALARYGTDNEDNNSNDEGRPPSPRKRKSPNDDRYNTDDDGWNERLRPRKKPSP